MTRTQIQDLINREMRLNANPALKKFIYIDDRGNLVTSLKYSFNNYKRASDKKLSLNDLADMLEEDQ